MLITKPKLHIATINQKRLGYHLDPQTELLAATIAKTKNQSRTKYIRDILKQYTESENRNQYIRSHISRDATSLIQSLQSNQPNQPKPTSPFQTNTESQLAKIIESIKHNFNLPDKDAIKFAKVISKANQSTNP